MLDVRRLAMRWPFPPQRPESPATVTGHPYSCTVSEQRKRELMRTSTHSGNFFLCRGFPCTARLFFSVPRFPRQIWLASITAGRGRNGSGWCTPSLLLRPWETTAFPDVCKGDWRTKASSVPHGTGDAFIFSPDRQRTLADGMRWGDVSLPWRSRKPQGGSPIPSIRVEPMTSITREPSRLPVRPVFFPFPLFEFVQLRFLVGQFLPKRPKIVLQGFILHVFLHDMLFERPQLVQHSGLLRSRLGRTGRGGRVGPLRHRVGFRSWSKRWTGAVPKIRCPRRKTAGPPSAGRRRVSGARPPWSAPARLGAGGP